MKYNSTVKDEMLKGQNKNKKLHENKNIEISRCPQIKSGYKSAFLEETSKKTLTDSKSSVPFSFKPAWRSQTYGKVHKELKGPKYNPEPGHGELQK